MSKRQPTPGRSSQPLELAEVFGQFRLKGFTATDPTLPIGLLAEDDGTLRQQLLLHDGTVQRRARSLTTGELVAVLHRDIVQLDPVTIPSADGILLDGSVSLGGVGIWEVTFEIVQAEGTANFGVTVWHDVGAGGTPAGLNEYILRDSTVPVGGSTGEIRVTIGGDDDLRGLGGGGTLGAIRFIRVERVDLT